MSSYQMTDTERVSYERNGTEVLIYVERLKKYKISFFNHYERVNRPTLFVLSLGEDRTGCSIQGGFLGRHMTLTQHIKNVKSFNLEKECRQIYVAFKVSESLAVSLDKQISSKV